MNSTWTKIENGTHHELTFENQQVLIREYIIKKRRLFYIAKSLNINYYTLKGFLIHERLYTGEWFKEENTKRICFYTKLIPYFEDEMDYGEPKGFHSFEKMLKWKLQGDQ